MPRQLTRNAIVGPLTASLIALLSASAAHAYLGPIAQVGSLGAMWGFLVAMALGTLSVIWYPFKRLWQMLRGHKPPVTEDESEPGEPL